MIVVLNCNSLRRQDFGGEENQPRNSLGQDKRDKKKKKKKVQQVCGIYPLLLFLSQWELLLSVYTCAQLCAV